MGALYGAAVANGFGRRQSAGWALLFVAVIALSGLVLALIPRKGPDGDADIDPYL